jgi:hypothetical protein
LSLFPAADTALQKFCCPQFVLENAWCVESAQVLQAGAVAGQLTVRLVAVIGVRVAPIVRIAVAVAAARVASVHGGALSVCDRNQISALLRTLPSIRFKAQDEVTLASIPGVVTVVPSTVTCSRSSRACAEGSAHGRPVQHSQQHKIRTRRRRASHAISPTHKLPASLRTHRGEFCAH